MKNVKYFIDYIKSFFGILTFHRRGNRIQRYGLPFILLLIFTIIKIYFSDIIGHDTPFLFITIVVLISSWFGGFLPGMLATILSSIVSNIFFLPQNLGIFSSENILRNGVFFVEGFFISLIAETQYQSELRKNQFIGFASHEIRNPLAVINGYLGLIHHHILKKKDEKLLSYTEKATRYTRIVTDLINDLLDISTIETGNFTYKDTYFQLNDVIKEAISSQKLITSTHTIDLVGHTKKYMYGDRYRIGQVITNLLTNAIKYSPDAHTVIIRIKDVRGGTIIRIKDFGIGISKEENTDMFEVSFRSVPVQKRGIRGTGFGLYISYQIIKHHRGKLWYKSKAGKGTTFFLYLPTEKNKNEPTH